MFALPHKLTKLNASLKRFWRRTSYFCVWFDFHN